MARFAALSETPSWFLVLPDRPAAGPVAAALRGQANRELTHPSGRPWILGRWPAGVAAAGHAGDTALVVIGQHAVGSDELDRAAARIRSVTDVDRFARSLVGSTHLIASVAGQVRVQGTVTGLRQVFHGRVDGVPVASDRADVLARLLGGTIDESRLALHLIQPDTVYPLSGRPVWRGVDVLGPGQYLTLDSAGGHRTRRWWTPPEPVLPLAEGADALREALSRAVAARVGGAELVSTDLGGLDSTAVTCMAAYHGASVVAYTAEGGDPLADDVVWANRTVPALGGVEHHLLPEAEMPPVYHRVLATDELSDEPCASRVDQDRWLVIARRAAARGSRLHLTGFGGDELLYGSLAHWHSLMATKPRTTIRYLRGFATKYNWSWRDVLRQLTDRRGYRAWLADAADTLTAPPLSLAEPLLDWGFQPRLPPWMTPATVETIRDLIRAEAQDVEPLSPRRGQHRELEGMRAVCRLARQFAFEAERFGVTMASPYYDDRVIEAGLAVRPEDRVTPWRYKPLIVEAMRGIVPEESRVRQTKANGSCDEEIGMRRNRADLLELWADSRLGELGLVDAAALRELCTRPLPQSLQFGALHQSVACEIWLRAAQGAPVPTGGDR